MSRRLRGTYSVIDNPVLAFAMRNRNANGSVLLMLAERSNYGQKAELASLPEIMIATGLRERAVETACLNLVGLGFVRGGPKGYAYQDTQQDTQEAAQIETKNTVPDGNSESLKELEGIRRKKEVTVGLVCTDRRSAQPVREDEQQGTSSQALDASPVQEKDSVVMPSEQPATHGQVLPIPVPQPPSPRAEHHGDDHNEVVFFHNLAGYNFVNTYRLDLARWAATYSSDFLRLAHRLAPTLPGAKGFYTFADLLNRDPRKPWPSALSQLYRAEQQGIGDVPGRAPQVGEILLCGDESGQVLEVDIEAQMVSIQNGRDHTEFITVPWSTTRPALTQRPA